MAYEGNAVVYCQAAFQTANGKTAHGLLRRSERYRIVCVLDDTCAGKDAGQLLDGTVCEISILATLHEAYQYAQIKAQVVTHFVVGIAPDGGRLHVAHRQAIHEAIEMGLNVVSGLHDFFSDDPTLCAAAARRGVNLVDVRKPPDRTNLHFFSGKISEVQSRRIAILGTDSAVGKRTTAWILVDALRQRGLKAQLIGTGQTAWLQGCRFGIVMDSLINDFVSGEIEHAIWSAWKATRADFLILEGQGSLLNPAYPGGYELLAAGQPHGIILQHSPARMHYDGFPGFMIHPIEHQLKVLQLLSDAKVLGITLNREGLNDLEMQKMCAEYQRKLKVPALDPLAKDHEKFAQWVIREFVDKW